jgi:hypothetical protein
MAKRILLKANRFSLAVIPLPNVPDALPVSRVLTSCHGCWDIPGWIRLPFVAPPEDENFAVEVS